MLGVQAAGSMTPPRQPHRALSVCEGLSASPRAGLSSGSAHDAGEASALDGGRQPEERFVDDAPERDAWVALLTVPGLGPVAFAGLLARFGSARAVLDAAVGTNDDVGSSQAMAALGADLAGRIRHQIAEADRTISVVRSLGLKVVTLDNPEYPDRLRLVEMPPPLLFVRGSTAALNAPSAVAVVGTRRPTDKGRMIAGWIGSALARAGSVVVSGLAVGIDGAAHSAVVGEGLPTVAVLGGGHARLFPQAHERLADAIVEAGGAIVAELPPETPATRGTFPRRNRLVSGLSDATVVVEAGRRSGALITAGWALEQGRECFLVPGPLDAPTSEGCHAFLRGFPGQTRVVCGVAELIEDLGLTPGVAASDEGGSSDEFRSRNGRPGPVAPGASVNAVLASLGPVERSVAESLVKGPVTTDELARQSGLPGATILSAITLLELRGFGVGSYGRYMPAGALARWPTNRSAASLPVVGPR